MVFFRTECHDPHFWLSLSSRFLGSTFRFDVQGGSEVRKVSGQWAAECGYTIGFDSWGDLLLCVCYLACLVENQVSVLKQLPTDIHIGMEWVTPAAVDELDEGLREWRVVFRIQELHQEGGMSEETVRMALKFSENDVRFICTVAGWGGIGQCHHHVQDKTDPVDCGCVCGLHHNDCALTGEIFSIFVLFLA
ncbi:uncharacterized protein LOC127419044 [Myxocyprinus asiaticus]|uniref:uncharacterized protein LOC127419044 n=1 Tax=Myxocyprinus asiaticus TaxID=70543 RepID=UPI0022226DAA|nr:uncharacterized protein LOC127419044 [Myxocyprinus asiaticus]